MGKRLENLVETDQMMKELQSYKFDPSRYDPTGGDGFVRGDWREVEDVLMDGVITDDEYEKMLRTHL